MLLNKVYRALSYAAEPFLKIHVIKRIKKGKEEAERINERFGISSLSREEGALIWLHAASVGESLAALPLISKIIEEYKVKVMVTTGTVTSAKLMKDKLPVGAFHQYIALDNPKWVRNFLNHWKPSLVLWTESEFWPNILTEIKERKIPALLLNVRISGKSYNKWKFAKGFISEILEAFSLCMGPRTEIEKLIQLGAKNAQVCDNIKYCTKAQAFSEDSLNELQKSIGSRHIVLWSSTHRGEEDIAVSIHKELLKDFPDIMTIILPRHPNRKEEIKELLAKSGMKAKFRSNQELPSAEDSFYVADTMGETGLLYKLCNICVMGGSFAEIGGHNIIEPAHFGCKIFYGPSMFNFATIKEDFEERKASLSVNTPEEMAEKLKEALKTPENFSKMGEEAMKLAKEKEKIMDNIMERIAPFIKFVL